jgi:adenine-specific DNA-methyltransferase
MRFIGSKSNLLRFIERTILRNCNGNDYTFGDFFCGTASVGTHFKELGFEIIANDNLMFCSTMAKARLLLNNEPQFIELLSDGEIPSGVKDKIISNPYNIVQSFLNNLSGKEGFIFKEYSPGGTKDKTFERRYFTDENAKKIDAIRNKIAEWKQNGLITDVEESLLLNDLLRATNEVANIAGTYGCYMKDWIDNRVWRSLKLRRTNIIYSDKEHRVFKEDANDLVKKVECDILYLDPPYNWRHYGAYYHILETIVLWDNPKVTGVGGLRPWEETKSRYCYRDEALGALIELLENARAKDIYVSYNNEGLISHGELLKTLPDFGKLTISEIPYRRYKSNSNGFSNGKVKERIYYVKKE